MSNLLLRKMTRKSIIGFGNYKDLTVQNLMDLQKHDELLSIYYNLEKIDFDDDVKFELCLYDYRQIPKPGKDKSAYWKHRGKILFDIISFNKTYAKDNPNRFLKLHQSKTERKHQIVSNCIRQNKEKSKIHNRDRNQSH